MDLIFSSEGDFSRFKVYIRNRLEERQSRILHLEGFKPAAVKMLFMNKNCEPFVLLTKRSENLKNHKGQVSFPGGTFDDKDGEIICTAYRETFEEVGIPSEDIEYLGQFDDYFSIMGFHVSCFVGVIPHPYEYIINSDEIDEFFEAPLSMFVNREYDRTEVISYEGNEYQVYYYRYGGHVIWGLTARILTDFGEEIMSGYEEFRQETAP